jgi:hypothetical protein
MPRGGDEGGEAQLNFAATRFHFEAILVNQMEGLENPICFQVYGMKWGPSG